MKSYPTSPIKLNLAEKLKDKGYFHRFFRGRAQDEVASQIKELREMRGLKQKELAKLCKTHQSAISRLEQATYSRWSVNTLWGLAEALGARVRIIFEPMEDIIKQYEELEREIEVPAILAETTEIKPRLAAMRGFGRAPIAGALSKAIVEEIKHSHFRLPIRGEETTVNALKSAAA